MRFERAPVQAAPFEGVNSANFPPAVFAARYDFTNEITAQVVSGKFANVSRMCVIARIFVTRRQRRSMEKRRRILRVYR